MASLRLTPSYIKILDTVNFLNEKKAYPLSEGVFKIVTGQKDDEILEYMDFPTYGTLVSFGSKKVSRYIMMLVRYGYLNKIYHKANDELYLAITDLGKSELLSFHKTHRVVYKKKNQINKPTILKL